MRNPRHWNPALWEALWLFIVQAVPDRSACIWIHQGNPRLQSEITDGYWDACMLRAAHLIGYTYGQKCLPKQLLSSRTSVMSSIPLHIYFFICPSNMYYLLCALQLFQLMTDMDSSLDFCDLRLAITQALVRGHWQTPWGLHIHPYRWWWTGVDAGGTQPEKRKSRAIWGAWSAYEVTPVTQSQSTLQHRF